MRFHQHFEPAAPEAGKITLAKLQFEVLEPDKRPVSAVADHDETRTVTHVEVEQASDIDLLMMFDPGHNLDERILSEQFRY